MASGKAHGVNRTYQQFCRDLLLKDDAALVPVSGDGVDVPLEAAGSKWTFDVALHVPSERLVVAECRRRIRAVQQDDLAAFAFKVDRLRQALGLPIAGVFFAKSRYQVGAVRSAQSEGISMATVGDRNTIAAGFAVEYHRWNAEAGRRAKDVTFHVGRPAGVLVVGGHAKLTVRRAAKNVAGNTGGSRRRRTRS